MRIQFFSNGLGLALCSCLLLAGCDSGEKRYRLQGNVTFKGKPVPEGYIVFEPDSSKGNTGGPGRAKILDGKYDTSADDNVGVLGGPHLIRIQGFDKKITGESAQEVALPKSLFTDYNVSEELPKQDGTKDFEIK
ncbi:MAG: hypothetical protein ACK56W_19790 [Pirellula sp.]|jgi:hypothetical protein|nr:hypothetical protein [Pirellula sp.]